MSPKVLVLPVFQDKSAVFRSKMLRHNASYIVSLPTSKKKSKKYRKQNSSRKGTASSTARTTARNTARSRSSARKHNKSTQSTQREREEQHPPVRQTIFKGDTCQYESPTGISEMVTVVEINNHRPGEEKE